MRYHIILEGEREKGKEGNHTTNTHTHTHQGSNDIHDFYVLALGVYSRAVAPSFHGEVFTVEGTFAIFWNKRRGKKNLGEQMEISNIPSAGRRQRFRGGLLLQLDDGGARGHITM